MPFRAEASFTVTSWEQSPYGEARAGSHLSRASVKKAFSGDLSGESTAELLMCQADPTDLGAGAGYVASELVEGELAGRSGTFVLQHGGLSFGSDRRTFGHVVPGSGTGDLAGLSGDVEISVDAEGAHSLVLDYDFA